MVAAASVSQAARSYRMLLASWWWNLGMSQKRRNCKKAPHLQKNTFNSFSGCLGFIKQDDGGPLSCSDSPWQGQTVGVCYWAESDTNTHRKELLLCLAFVLSGAAAPSAMMSFQTQSSLLLFDIHTGWSDTYFCILVWITFNWWPHKLVMTSLFCANKWFKYFIFHNTHTHCCNDIHFLCIHLKLPCYVIRQPFSCPKVAQ